MRVYYELFLQTPEAEAALGRDIHRTFRSQVYSLSGDIPPYVGGGFFLNRSGLLAGLVAESDIDVYVAEITRSGFRGP
jgi:hypothetical protein